MSYKKLLLVLLLVVPATGYAQDEGGGESVLFMGVVTDFPDEFVGVAVDGEAVTLYICDGNAEEGTVTIAQWFVGDVVDDAIDITAPNGRRIEVAVEADRASGKVTFPDGTVREFTAMLSTGKAALFRSEFQIGDDSYVGGWLIQEDGSVRGAIFKSGSGELVAASFSGGNQVFQIDPIDLPAR